MKNLFLLFVSIVFFSYNVNSQEQSPSTTLKNEGIHHENIDQRAQQSVDRLDKIVTLTPEQKIKVSEFALNRATKVEEIRRKYKGQDDKREQARAELFAAHKEYEQSVDKLLTAEQFIKMKEFRKTNKNKEESRPVPSPSNRK